MAVAAPTCDGVMRLTIAGTLGTPTVTSGVSLLAAGSDFLLRFEIDESSPTGVSPGIYSGTPLGCLVQSHGTSTRLLRILHQAPATSAWEVYCFSGETRLLSESRRAR